VTVLSGANKIALLKRYATEYRLRTFVETGTYDGDTSAEMAAFGLEVYTCELSPEFYLRCRVRFGDNPRIHLSLDDSRVWLPRVLGSLLTGPVLVWLDAHHSDAGSAPGYPLAEELKHVRGCDVTLIDDIRLLSVYGLTLADLPRGELADDILRCVP
jgi:hypothetical protein